MQIPRYPTNAHEALQNQAGEWKLLHLESKHIVKIRSWDSTDSSEPSALCARLEITALRPGGVPEVFSFPSKCVNNPSFEYPAEGTLQDSQIVDCSLMARVVVWMSLLPQIPRPVSRV